MSEERKVVNPGEYVAFSTGEYSDYSMNMIGRCLKTIDVEVWEAMREASTRPSEYNNEPAFQDTSAMQWFINEGYVESIDYRELHLGDYGECSSWANA